MDRDFSVHTALRWQVSEHQIERVSEIHNFELRDLQDVVIVCELLELNLTLSLYRPICPRTRLYSNLVAAGYALQREYANVTWAGASESAMEKWPFCFLFLHPNL